MTDKIKRQKSEVSKRQRSEVGKTEVSFTAETPRTQSLSWIVFVCRGDTDRRKVFSLLSETIQKKAWWETGRRIALIPGTVGRMETEK